MKLSGILIGSEQPERLAGYYTDIFGKPSWDDGGYTGWEFGGAWIMIGAHDKVKGKSAHPGRIIWNLETPDVKKEFEKLKAAGATVVQEPYTPGDGGGDGPEMLIATFSDPDDNYFQLVSPM
jgi:predicted enzyme related to lactoylglutathione lyase